MGSPHGTPRPQVVVGSGGTGAATELALSTTRTSLSRAVALVTAVAASAGVGGLAEAAAEGDGASRLDPVVAAEILEVRTPALTAVAQSFTVAGSEVVVGGIALILLVGLTLRGHLGRAATFALGMGGSVVLTVALKLWVGRLRPPTSDRLGPVDSTFSFPSGHTLNSIVLLVLISSLLWTSSSGSRRLVLVIFGTVVALGVASSRVYLGYHWTTDLMASCLVALGWLSVVWLLAPLLHRAVERLSGLGRD